MALKNKNLLTGIILGLILLLALFLRVYSLSSNPLGFHIDEASLGYNAYSILMTGKDASGKAFPLYISMFNDNNPSGYYYMAAVTIKFFGLTEFATRLPAAVFGALGILAIYLLSLSVFKDKKISLLSAFLGGIAPWSIVMSRGSAETLVACFFVILGFALIIFYFQNRKLSFLLSGTLSLFLSYFIYPAPRLFVPLLFFLLLLFLYSLLKKENIRFKIFTLLSFLFLSLSSLFLVFAIPGGSARFNQVSIFSFPETKLVEEEQIREDGVMHTGVLLTRLFHNKPINYSLTFINNYFEYFKGDFLFTKGGEPPLLRIPEMGLLYLLELPFILLGIFYIFTGKNKYHKILLIWLLAAPVASALTVDDSPNVRRALIMFPAMEIMAAYGFFIFIERYKNKTKAAVVSMLAVLLFFNFLYFMHQYFVHQPIDKNWYRNEGFGEMVSQVTKNSSGYNYIVVTKSEGGIYPLILFFTKYDPVLYQKEGSTGDKEDTGFGKFFFVLSQCPSKDSDPKVPKGKLIFVDNGTCPYYDGLSSKKYNYIDRLDGTRVFRIVYE